MTHPHEAHPLTSPQRLYLVITAIFVTCLLTADLIGSKLFEIPLAGWKLEHSIGMIPFPVTFLLTDLLNEYYGQRAARRVTYVAFACAGLCFLFLVVGQRMPISPRSVISQEQYDAVFGSAKFMYLASLAAFLAGQLTDIAVFGALKRLTAGKALWLRATGSTVVSQMIDSFVVTTLFFKSLSVLGNGEPVTMGFILRTAATGYTLKFFIAVLLTPLIYLGHGVIHRWFGLKPLPPEDAPAGSL